MPKCLLALLTNYCSVTADCVSGVWMRESDNWSSVSDCDLLYDKVVSRGGNLGLHQEHLVDADRVICYIQYICWQKIITHLFTYYNICTCISLKVCWIYASSEHLIFPLVEKQNWKKERKHSHTTRICVCVCVCVCVFDCLFLFKK